MAVVQSQMTYLEPWIGEEEGPYVRGKVEDSFPGSNFENQEYSVVVHDARPTKSDFSLDIHGFAFHDDEPITDETVQAIRERNKLKVEALYYQSVENLVKKSTGASKVIISIIRIDGAIQRFFPIAENNRLLWSAIGAVGRVRRHAGKDAERLLQERAHIINVWRPIHGTVEDWALALMDYRTLKSSEIPPTSIFRERHEMQGQTVSINYSADQRWYYLDKQKVTEVTFIKIWDSVAKMCAHCAFPNPNAPTDSLPRESIEAHCLVFYENKV
ncbi:methyltransferase [Hypoxylon cercidicola]|nr:methyltransferase [Hypoxylon cercidicola]